MLMRSSFPRKIVSRADLTRSDAVHNDDHTTRRVGVNLLDEGIGDTLVLSRRDERSYGRSPIPKYDGGSSDRVYPSSAARAAKGPVWRTNSHARITQACFPASLYSTFSS